MSKLVGKAYPVDAPKAAPATAKGGKGKKEPEGATESKAGE